MWRAVRAFAVLACAAALVAPVVDVLVSAPVEAPAIISGNLRVSWSQHPSAAVESYVVTVTPLNAFDSVERVLDPAYGWHTFGVGFSTAPGALLISGRGETLDASCGPPFAVRKVPIGSAITVDSDCAPLFSVHTSSVCGVTVYDGGSNATLFRVVLRSTDGGATASVVGEVPSGAATGGRAIATAPTMTGGAAWSPSQGLRVRLTRGPAVANRSWVAEVTPAVGPASGTTWTNLTLPEASMGGAVPWAWTEADLWYGMTAYGWGGSAASVGTARFTAFHVALAIPMTAPPTLYGGADACLAAGGVQTVTVRVPATNLTAVVTGLSGYFPYTVTVQAVEVGTGVVSAPSAPLPGLYLYPRPMPPRQQMLGWWLDTRQAPGGAIARIPDASMRGHDLLQPVAGMRPTVVGGNLYNPSRLTLTRSRGTVMASGADTLDLGMGSNFTVYVMARGTTSVPQILLGRGGPASTITSATSPGWALAVYNTLYSPFPGFLAFKTHRRTEGGSRPEGENAAVMHDWWIPNTGVWNWWVAASPTYVFVAEKGAGESDAVTLRGARDTNEAFTTGVADAAGGNTTGWPSVWWNGSAPVAGSGTSDSMAFRLGSKYGPTPDTVNAFDGDVYQAVIYREAHDATTRQAVTNWLQLYYAGQQCMQTIAAPTGVDSSGICSPQAGGLGSLRCHQSCKGGMQYFLGTWGDHWCGAGAWSGAPLLCKRGCGTAMPPLYAASCYRTILSEDFNEGESYLRYVPMPAIPWPQQARVWTIVGAPWAGGKMLSGDTTYTNACARIASAPSIYGIHPTRWNDWYNPWGTRMFTSLAVMLQGGNTTRAGLAFRLNDMNSHYRAVLTEGPGGLVLERVAGGRVTVVGRAPLNFSVALDTWIPLEATYNLNSFTVSSNNATLINVADAGGPSTGSVGMFLSGTAQFANLTVNSTCDAFLVGRNMVANMSVTYKCRAGYTALGNESWTCGSDGTYGGASLICRSRPPVFGNYTFNVAERSPNGTLIGVATAWPAGADQTVTYELVSQYPPPATNTSGPTFIVVSCSGAIRVVDPYALDFQLVQQYNLTLKAVPDAQEISAAFTNVTVNVINVIDPPQIINTQVAINETQVGAVSGPIEVYNPDAFTLEFEIGAGDINSLFTIDKDTGVVYVKPPGLNYANGDSYDLLVSASTPEDLTLVTTGILTINVLDVNNAPVIADDTLYTPEGLCTAGTFLGLVQAQDVDVNPEWNNATVAITTNANKGASTDIFRAISSTGALYFDKTLAYTDADAIYWFGEKRARDIFALTVTACDNGGLCTNALVTVVVLVTGNVTGVSSTITGISWPSTTGMATAGGDVIRFTGLDFPLAAGVVISADYSNAGLGAFFRATNCFVKTETQLQCSAAEGYGGGLTWRVFVDAKQVPSSVALITAYAPPTLTSVTLDTTGLSTAGSAQAALVINGDNFGKQGSVVTVKYGPSGASSTFTVPTLNSVSHSVIRATLGAGCGANLEVVVTVAGQASTTLNPGASTITYPTPTITSIAPPVGYTLLALPTVDSVDMVLMGTNLGPATLPSSMPLTVTATYANDRAGLPVTFSYSVACRKDDTLAAHTRVVCPLAPGVSTGFQWALDVCGQVSASSADTTGYAVPQLTRVSGPGSLRANTDGGQSVTLDGSDFGPPCCDGSNPQSIRAVQYGTPGQWQYAAQGCAVTSTKPPQITCLTGPGTGKSHVWRVDIGGQWSPVLPANTSYSPPIIYNFAGATDAAGTEGGANVTIMGTNFGDDFSKIAVTYTDYVSEVSAFTGALPSDVDGGVEPGTDGSTLLEPGHLVYTPPWCVLTQAHKALTCGLKPGGGTGMSWVVVVDSQISTAPTTSYGLPRIDSVALAVGGSVASSDGGQVVTLRGVNFGEAHLIQSITYGPSGREYAVAGNFTWLSHFRVDVTLSPSIPLGPMAFTLMTADQASQPSAATITITQPVVVSITPSQDDTEVDPARPVLIRVSGIEFGLLDGTAEVSIAFGNAADRTLLPLISPAGRQPSLLDITSPETTGWARPASPISQTLVFALPSGMGKARAVRVVAYRRGSPPSLAQVAAMTTQGPAAFFSYRDPFVDYIVVLPTSEEERNATVLALGGVQALNGTDPGSIVKLEINGRYFGPPQSVNKDGVQRIIEENLGGSRTSSAPFVVGNWSHRLITVFSLRPSGSIRVNILAMSADGATQLQQTSAWSSFSDISPSVDGLVGRSTGFQTVGGEEITLTATGLGNAVSLNVTVGGRYCPLLDGPGGALVLDTVARSRIIVPQGLPPGTTRWTLHCVLPEGQGASPVVLIRDGVRSSGGVLVTYAPPTVSAVSGRDADFLPLPPFVMTPWRTGVPIVAPTMSYATNRTVRIEGDNLGTCPTLKIVLAVPIRIDACVETTEAGTGRPIVTPNPSVSRSHTWIEFVAPDGVGTGMDVVGGAGWTLTLSAGGQDATNGLLLYRHMPPVVVSIAPGSGSTKGGATLTVKARHMGPATRVPKVALGNARRSYMPCTGVTRVDATTVTCSQPEGSGLLLDARVTVADLAGFGGQFNYTPPSITAISVAAVLSVSVNPGNNASVYTFSAPSATLQPSASLDPAPQFLRLPAVPARDTVLIFDGSSFGPRETDNCVFAAWADRAALVWSPSLYTPPTTGPLMCNGHSEDFLGEGQVPFTDVLEWGHDRVVVRAPRGTGRRVLTVRAGGQGPAADVEYPSLRFDAPTITSPCVGLTELDTNGGGRALIPARDVPRPPFGGGVYGDAVDMADFVGGSEEEGIDYTAYAPSGNGSTGVPWLDFPGALPLPVGFQSPTEHVVVTLGSRCLSSAVDLSGLPPPFIAAKRCVTGAVLSQSRKGIVFTVPPGVGANKSVTVVVYSAARGVEVSTSVGGRFSYDPPAISRVEPSPVYVRLAYIAAGSGNVDGHAADAHVYASQYVLVSGKNFGRLSDSEEWSEEERAVSVRIAGISCNTPERIVRLGNDILQCKLDAKAPVGRHNVSVAVGGQEGGVPGDERGLFVVCSSGLYGFVGDACTPCPNGAECPGFVPDEDAVRDSGLNASLLPIRVGRVQYDVGGMHMGPIPKPGFYNLNETDAECPPFMLTSSNSRGVCVVPCMDAGACLGDNVCGEAYASLAPLYRCSSCAKGYYRRAGECEKCPQNAAAQFMLLLAAAAAAAAAAYTLNKYRINPGFISIGLDFFQVVAIFANSKVKWPTALKELFYILSAFNLNLELLAPECFIPEVTFANKFGAVMSLPIGVYVTFFLTHAVRVAWKRVWHGQTDWVKINAHLPGMISSSLLLLYVLYLYVTKTILDVFNCVPTEPPDGKLYLQAVFEECGVPGGAQMTLFPYAILCCIVYVVGYPAAVANVLWANKELIMEDQLLRAKGVGEDRLSNPHAYDLRRTVSRVYFLFKPIPNRIFWILVIILRKFLIAFVSLIFARNTAFQMAAALLVLFLAYAAQVRYRPYMSPDETEQVIRDLLQLSVSSPLHNRLRATLSTVEQSGRKRAHANKLLVRDGHTTATLLRAVAGMLMNYNTVDASLLFACCLVNLSGLLYEAARPSDSYYASSRDGVTGCVMFVIAVASFYWFSVMVADISAQFSTVLENRSSAQSQHARSLAARKLSRKLSAGPGSPFTGLSAASFDGASASAPPRRMPTNVFTAGLQGLSTGKETTMVNPMFTRKDGSGAAEFSAEQTAATVAALLDAPDLSVWNIIRESYLEQHSTMKNLGSKLSEAKMENARLKEAVDIAGIGGYVLDPREAARNASGAAYNRQATRREFGGSKRDAVQSPSGFEVPDEGVDTLVEDALGGAKRQFSPTAEGAFEGGDGAPFPTSAPPASSSSSSPGQRSSIRLFGFEIGNEERVQRADAAPKQSGSASIAPARGGVGSLRAMFGLGGGDPAVAGSDSIRGMLGFGGGAGGSGPPPRVSMASLKASAAMAEAEDAAMLAANPLVRAKAAAAAASREEGAHSSSAPSSASPSTPPAAGAGWVRKDSRAAEAQHAAQLPLSKIAAMSRMFGGSMLRSTPPPSPSSSIDGLGSAGAAGLSAVVIERMAAGESPLIGRGRKPGGRLAGKVIRRAAVQSVEVEEEEEEGEEEEDGAQRKARSSSRRTVPPPPPVDSAERALQGIRSKYRLDED